MAFLHTRECSNVPGVSGPGVPLCTIVPRDVQSKKKKNTIGIISFHFNSSDLSNFGPNDGIVMTLK